MSFSLEAGALPDRPRREEADEALDGQQQHAVHGLDRADIFVATCAPRAIQAPGNVTRAREIFSIGIHNSKYFLAPRNQYSGGREEG